MPSIEPSPEQLQKFISDSEAEGPIVMINLLCYRDHAEYPSGLAAQPCSGRDAYQRYSAAVLPLLTAVGAKVLWLGNVKRTVIGPESERWDDAILVQYPSRKAFLPRLPARGRTSHAALADSRLIATVGASFTPLSESTAA